MGVAVACGLGMVTGMASGRCDSAVAVLCCGGASLRRGYWRRYLALMRSFYTRSHARMHVYTFRLRLPAVLPASLTLG